jgi:hypothetical protein
VATVASAQVAAVGFVLSDKVMLTGMNGQSGTLLATLYGPLPADAVTGCAHYTDVVWRAAVASAGPTFVAGESSTEVTGDGTYVVTPVRLAERGCYSYAEKLTPAATPNSAVTTPYGVPSESTVVVAPAVHTIASAHAVPVGASIRDHVRVTGTNGLRGVVTGELLGPIADHNGACAGLNWAGADVAATITPLPVAGDGAVVTAPIRLPAAGCYTFVESLFLAGVTTPFVHTATGVPAETVVVRPPVAGPPPTPPLATTGGRTRTTALFGSAAMLAGAALTFLGRRRRS